jgi:hypothetical protein
LIGVRHYNTLLPTLHSGVIVIGRTAKDRGALLDAHDSGQGTVVTRGVTNDPDPIANHDTAPAEFAGPHRHHKPVVNRDTVTTPVDGHHHAVVRLVVAGAGARTRA